MQAPLGIVKSFTIPNGLRELMSDIAREVLRVQPTNILEFIADYLDALCITRVNAMTAMRTTEQILEWAVCINDKLLSCGLDVKIMCTQDITSILLTAFREYETKKEDGCEEKLDACLVLKKLSRTVDLSPYDEDELQFLIRSAFIAYIEHKRCEGQLPISDEKELETRKSTWMCAAENTINLYKWTCPRDCEMQHAATIIQAAYRAYYARRNIEYKSLHHQEPVKDADATV